jgi:hypothetical protein
MPTQQVKLAYQGSPTYKGVDVSIPETDIDAASTPFVNNVILRKGEIKSRYRMSPLFPAPQDGTATLGFSCFFDINAVMHTVAITRLGIYQLSFNWPSMVAANKNPWLILANFPQGQPNVPYATQVLQTLLFFSNGGTNVFQWNGLTNTIQTIDGFVNGTSFSAVYMMELASKLIVAYTIETLAGVTNIFPYRIRWSSTPVSLANTFDVSANISAGFNDELDVPDIITGMAPIGRTGYVYRNNGISEMIPNSQGTGFDFDHLWASDRGIGNVLPQSLAAFGPMNIFVAGDNIYQITPNSFNPIGGRAYNAIANDLQNVYGVVTATILPYFARNHSYTVYELNIPLNDDVTSVKWLYDINEQSWVRNTYLNKIFTAKTRLVYTQ